jgi:hypothetical protein
MLNEPIALPDSEGAHLRELNRMLQGGPPALVGADGEKLELPDAVFRLLKDIVRNMQLGRAVILAAVPSS